MRFHASLSVWFVPAIALASHTLSPTQEAVLKRWLEYHPPFRMANLEDCACASDIENMRRGYGGELVAVPDYHPYIAVGDFNDDGTEDFAVVIVDRNASTSQYAFAVFNGPFKLSTISPAFFEEGLDLKRQGLFFGHPRPKPYRLIRGAFESEGGILEPNGTTYSWRWDDP